MNRYASEPVQAMLPRGQILLKGGNINDLLPLLMMCHTRCHVTYTELQTILGMLVF